MSFPKIKINGDVETSYYCNWSNLNIKIDLKKFNGNIIINFDSISDNIEEELIKVKEILSLLLSYPCVESFELSNFIKQFWKTNFSSAMDAKKKMKEIIPELTDIDEKSLMLAIENMHRTMYFYGIRKYDPSNFKKENLKIFRKESEEYLNNKYFNALSLIGIMLIDLGIITEV